MQASGEQTIRGIVNCKSKNSQDKERKNKRKRGEIPKKERRENRTLRIRTDRCAQRRKIKGGKKQT